MQSTSNPRPRPLTQAILTYPHAKLWDVKIGRLIRTFEGHSKPVHSVAFSPDGQRVLSGGWDNTVKLWEAGTGRVIRTFWGHSDMVRSVAFSPDGQRVLSASWDKTAKVWDTKSGRLIRTFEGQSGDDANHLNSVAISPDGRQVLLGSGTKNGQEYVKLWELKIGRLIRTFEGHSSYVFSVAFSPDGQHVLSAGWEDKTQQHIKLWEANTGRLKALGGKHWKADPRFRSTAGHRFSRVLDGHYALSGSRDNKVRLWEVSSGRLIRTLEGHSGFVWSVAFSPTAQWTSRARPDGW